MFIQCSNDIATLTALLSRKPHFWHFELKIGTFDSSQRRYFEHLLQAVDN